MDTLLIPSSVLQLPAAAVSPQDGDAFGSPHLGTAVLEPYELMEKKHFSGWLPLRGRTGRQQGLGKAQIRVSVDYFPTLEVGLRWPGPAILLADSLSQQNPLPLAT
jgi:hypothetical protein